MKIRTKYINRTKVLLDLFYDLKSYNALPTIFIRARGPVKLDVKKPAAKDLRSSQKNAQV